MSSIQGILIACIAATAVLGGALFRAKLIHRLVVIALCFSAIVFVLFPDVTTMIAHSLGVGRGADLLFYVSLMAGGQIVLRLYRKTRDLEKKITEQIRAMALRDAQYTGEQ